MLRLPACSPRILVCLCCLIFSGCAVNQAALFSVAPEYDKTKLSALARAAESRRQDTPDKTHEDVKSDQVIITGFNKFQIPPQPEPETISLPPLPEERQSVVSVKKEKNLDLEFDESTDFQAIELTGVRFPVNTEVESDKEQPIEAKKPEIEPEFFLIQQVPPAPVTPAQPETNSAGQDPTEKKSPRLVEMGLKPLTTLTLNTRPPTGELPSNTAGKYLGELPTEKVAMGTTRDWNLTTKEWVAPAVPHNPLYFEEPYLERYGYNYGPAIQPFISAGRFFGRIPALPYMIGAYPLYECQYSLGYERPGNCPPYQVERLPFSARGALFESLTVTGLVFLIP